MYGRMAAVGVMMALLGGAAGVAAMTPYVTPPPDPAMATPEPEPGVAADVPGVGAAMQGVGERVGEPVCQIITADGHAQQVPVIAEASRTGVALVDALGELAGSGACMPPQG